MVDGQYTEYVCISLWLDMCPTANYFFCALFYIWSNIYHISALNLQRHDANFRYEDKPYSFVGYGGHHSIFVVDSRPQICSIRHGRRASLDGVISKSILSHINQEEKSDINGHNAADDGLVIEVRFERHRRLYHFLCVFFWCIICICLLYV